MEKTLRTAAGALGLVAVLAAATPAKTEQPGGAATAAASGVPAGPGGGAASGVGAANPAGAGVGEIDAGKVKEAVRELAADAVKWGGTAGAIVVDVGSGKVLAAAEEHAAMNPASNAKLATAAAALRVMGPEHRFLTGIYGKIKGERVGALVLRGHGDPTLTSDDLLGMARDLKGRGVKRVDAVLVDQGYFDDVYTPPAFAQQPNEWAPFRAPVSAVAVDANTLTVVVRPGEDGKAAAVTVEPAGVAKVAGSVKTTKKGDPEKVGVSVGVQSGSLTVKVSGSVPEGGDPVRAWKRLEDPRIAGGLALRAALQAVGIEVGDEVKQGGEKEKELLAVHRSDTLAHVLSRLGKDSDNFVAEMVFKAIGAEKKGRPGTFAGAAEVVTAELTAMGAFESGCSVTNGSGLFDANRTTAAATATLLRKGYQDGRVGPELVGQLAVGGVDGTLRSRFKAWAGARAIRAKTGTLNATFALSGYVLGPAGKGPLAFALFVNGAKGKAGAARARMDKVVDAAARALWGAPPR